MDYEKEYKKKLEEAKYWHDCSEGDIPAILEEIFSELKESKDEKIRKSLIQGFNECLDSSSYPKNAKKYWHGIAIDDILTWLEKQGQNPTTDIQNLTWEDIGKIGDFINMVRYENPNGIGAECLYTDVLERFLDGKQTKQKPAWSEEDERNLKSIMKIIKEKAFADYDVDEDNNMLGIYGILESWLKSLKDRVHPLWKPSEEHIRYLQAVVNDVHNIGSESCCIALRDLLEQLKKL